MLPLEPLCCCWNLLLQAVKDRMERALSQRMYLIRSTELDESSGRKFELVGSTGNLYTVVMAQLLQRVTEVECGGAGDWSVGGL